MRKQIVRWGFVIAAALGLIASATAAQDTVKPLPTENFYNKSLHYTNRGIAYLYSKEAGGLERLTGISADSLGCLKANCHVQSCDACHVKEVNGKPVYTTDPAVAQAACDRCHPVEKDDPDVHIQKGMKCMDCHTAREIHGDGTMHDFYKQSGVLETTCEKCHATISQSASHTVHKGRLDCIACHTNQTVTCFNCHIDSRLKKDKVSSFQTNNLLFLINHDGKVTTGNLLTYVYGNKTMITIAPTFAHSIKTQGRACAECHSSKMAKDIKRNRFKPVTWVKDSLQSIGGVVPVVEGMKWNLVWLTRQDNKWVPLKNPEAPLFNFSAQCTPLSQEQFARILAPQGAAKK